jgi:hypothetical protein
VTDFSVQPAALRELSAMLGRARVDIDKAKTHLAKMENFEGGTGYLGYCLDGHKAAYRALSDWLGELADPTVSGAAAAVADSADYYEKTDATAAANLDATYPATNVVEYKDDTGYHVVESEGSARFADVVTPGSHLTEKPHDYGNELYGNTLDWWDALSVMSLAGMAIQRVTEVAVMFGWIDKPFNPMKELAEEFVGDWAGARQAADILRNVGRTVNDIGLNIQWAAQGTDQVWQGNAGNGATVYLMNLARRFDVDNAWPPIDTLAKQYVEASTDMMNLRDAAVGILNSIGDDAVEAAIACSVGGGAASTGVGAPVAVLAALYAGYKIARVVDGVAELLDVIGKLKTATSLLIAAQDGFAGPGRLTLPMLPATPIHTPR